MKVRRRKSEKEISVPREIAEGVLIAIVVNLLGAGITAWLISSEKLPETATGYGALAIVILASFLGAVVAAKRTQRQRMVICLIAGGAYFILLLAATALFFDGRFSNVGGTALAVIAGCCTAGLLGFRVEKHAVSKRRNNFYR